MPFGCRSVAVPARVVGLPTNVCFRPPLGMPFGLLMCLCPCARRHVCSADRWTQALVPTTRCHRCGSSCRKRLRPLNSMSKCVCGPVVGRPPGPCCWVVLPLDSCFVHLLQCVITKFCAARRTIWPRVAHGCVGLFAACTDRALWRNGRPRQRLNGVFVCV